MICPNPHLRDERARLWAERQRLLCEMQRVNHQLAIEAEENGLTIEEALRIAKEAA